MCDSPEPVPGSPSAVRAPGRALPSGGSRAIPTGPRRPPLRRCTGQPAGSWRARGPVPYSMAALWRRARPPAVSGLCRTLRALSGTRYPRGSGPAAAAHSPLPARSGCPRLLTRRARGTSPKPFAPPVDHRLERLLWLPAVSPLYSEAGRAAAASIHEGSGRHRRARCSRGARPSAPGC